jgi:pimeloyl-ACP methyl ester carboxylesterase
MAEAPDKFMTLAASHPGVPGSPALILIHGGTFNWASWNPVRHHLDPRWRVVAVDLPGHGARRDEPYTLEGAARVVAEAAREVAPAKVVLIGDSLGGYSAMAAAASIPKEQLAALVIGGCSQNFEGKSLRQLRMRWLLFRIVIPLVGEQRIVSVKIPKLLRRMGHSDADASAMMGAHIRLRAFGEAVAALENVDFLPRVAAIQAPIVFFNGDKDPMPLASEAKFVATAPRAEAKHFECEHGVTLWRAAEFARFANDYIERVVVRGGR